MIVDTMDHFAFYAQLDARLRPAQAFLEQAMNNPDLPEGRHEIAGDDAYGLIRRYQTQPLKNQRLEAHRQYIDIQLMVRGQEKLIYQEVSRLTPAAPYDPASDCALFSGEGTPVRLSDGVFVILYPQDAHLPKLCAPAPSMAVKAIVKVKV